MQNVNIICILIFIFKTRVSGRVVVRRRTSAPITLHRVVFFITYFLGCPGHTASQETTTNVSSIFLLPSSEQCQCQRDLSYVCETAKWHDDGYIKQKE